MKKIDMYEVTTKNFSSIIGIKESHYHHLTRKCSSDGTCSILDDKVSEDIPVYKFAIAHYKNPVSKYIMFKGYIALEGDINLTYHFTNDDTGLSSLFTKAIDLLSLEIVLRRYYDADKMIIDEYQKTVLNYLVASPKDFRIDPYTCGKDYDDDMTFLGREINDIQYGRMH